MNQLKVKNEKLKKITLWMTLCLVIFNFSFAFAQDRPARVLLDCREGIG